MAGTPKSSGPTALTTTYTTNIYNGPSALIYEVVKAIHITNKTGSAVTFRLYKGLTGANTAGTELFYDQTVAPYSSFDWYPANLVLKSTDFLVGGASATTSLVFNMNTEQIVVP
jgi:hypothetical protein